ncbi:MAG TPA: hypothetical protein VJ741_22740, partial [Solirubrobacteraceae bacterium]|nr:hypothetical protein [Solirubrobacteraceae bacterium]
RGGRIVGRGGLIAGTSRSRDPSRRPRMFPAHYSRRRRWTLVAIGLVAFVLLIVTLLGGGKAKHPAASVPAKPAAATAPVSQSLPAQTTATPPPVPAPAAPKHKASAPARKSHPAAHRKAGAKKPASRRARSAGPASAATPPVSSNPTAVTVAPAPHYVTSPPPVRATPPPSTGLAGTSLPSALSHRRPAGKHKKR